MEIYLMQTALLHFTLYFKAKIFHISKKLE